MENQMNGSGHWAEGMTFKMGLVTVMALLLLIPLAMIKRVIGEREETSQRTENEVSAQWGNAQTLVGPVLNFPVEVRGVLQNGQIEVSQTWLHVMPEELKVAVQLEPEVRYRGIYKTAVYNSTSVTEGAFVLPDDMTGVPGEIDWGKAYLTFGVGDNRGIRGEVTVLWDGVKLPTQSGLVSNDIASSGFSVRLPACKDCVGKRMAFRIEMELSGSQGLSVLPLGQNTSIEIASTWTDPSFTGSLLPQRREISEKGFKAQWTLTHLNRNFPQYWTGRKFDVGEHQLGVSLFLPVNHYQKSFRSAKYGILFISLTMLVFLFMELTKKKRVHLFQYLLVGLALVLFFSVLTALSEHVGFNVAYWVAAAAIVGMIGFYSFGILHDRVLAGWVVGLLVVLYGFLFVLLQLNDFAFLAGNIGLIVVLGIVMKASLKLKGVEE
ncbi:MAG: cell envelope integrity protein CreD [Marinilabiliaceae bacterium]|nr:cell envelope integrity protein CreD [Marinilabiliaceae bacterium]